MQEALIEPLIASSGGCGDAALAAATCALLHETYTAAIDRLTLCVSSGGDATGQAGEEHDGSTASEDFGWAGGAGGAPRGAADAGQLEARRGKGAGGGGGGAEEQRGLVALGRRCLREVQGSLDEVVGLDAIKQASRAGMGVG